MSLTAVSWTEATGAICAVLAIIITILGGFFKMLQRQDKTDAKIDNLLEKIEGVKREISNVEADLREHRQQHSDLERRVRHLENTGKPLV